MVFLHCFALTETSLLASDYAQLPADAVLFLSIRVPQAHVVTATVKVTYLPAGKVPEGELLTNRQSCTGSQSISLSCR
jgi:hypothetical protein